MDKDMNTKINDILSKNDKRELRIEELDMVTGGYSESDLNAEERLYIQELMKAYVDACLTGKNEEAQKYEQLILEFDQKIREKYD